MNAHDGGTKEVAHLAWPLAVGMLSYTLMSLVDTLLMGHVSTAAQAGVGLATTFAFACMIFFRGLASGAQSLVAAADGARDSAKLRAAGSAGVWIGALSGLAATLLLLLSYRAVLGWAVSDVDVATSCSRYLEVRAWGLPFALLGFGCLAGLQGIGETRTRMWVSLAGNLTNVGLDLVLIFGCGPIPAWGEAGAAVATVVSNALIALLYGLRYRQLFGSLVRPGADVVRRALQVGLPSGCQGLVGVGAFLGMNLVLARTGAAHLAASEIVLRITSVSFLPGFGVGEAAGVLVGRYLGAGERRTAARAVHSARILAAVLMGLAGLVFLTEGQWLASWFTRDPRVVTLAGRLMLFAAAFQVFDALAMVHLCALRGAGDTRFTLLLTILGGWGLLIPGAVVFGLLLGWGAPGAWLGLTCELAVIAAISGWRVRGLETGSVGRLDLLLGTT